MSLTRRQLLALGLTGAGALALAACGGGAAPASTPASASPSSAAPKPAASSPAAAASSAASAKPAASASAAASPAGAYKPVALNPTVKLKFSSIQGLGNGVYWIGQDRGFFKDEGLEIEFVNIASATEAIPQVAGNNIDAGTLVAGAAVYNGVARDIPIRIVADAGQLRPGFGGAALIVRKDLVDSGAVKDVKDVKGRTVAITGKGVLTHYLIGRTMESVGLTVNDVNLVVMQAPDMLPALAAKQVDMAESLEPFVAQGAAQGVSVRFLGYDQLLPNTQVTTLMFSPRLVKDNRDLGTRLATAWLRAVQVFNAAFGPEKKDYDATIQLFATNSKVNPDIIKQSKLLGYDPKGVPNTRDLGVQQDWYVKQGLVQKPITIEDLTDLSLMQAAVQKLGL